MREIKQGLLKKIFCELFFPILFLSFCHCSLRAHTGSGEGKASSLLMPSKLIFESCYSQVQSSFQAGDGSAAYPYVICNFAQLKNIPKDPNAHYALGQDINASQTSQKSYNQNKGWEPIRHFRGSFDGAGFTIYNLHLRHANPGASLFSGFFANLAEGARVHNLGIKNINITITLRKGPGAKSIAVGCLAASSNRAKVRHSYAKGKIIVRNLTNNLRAELGGLIGYQDHGSIDQSYADCHIHLSSLASQGITNAGGLTGLSAGKASIEKSYASGKIIIAANHVRNIGALVGTSISGEESFKGINYYLKSEVKNAVGSGSCHPRSCLEIKRDHLENINETFAPLDWDTEAWLARSEGFACLKNSGPYGQSCP